MQEYRAMAAQVREWVEEASAVLRGSLNHTSLKVSVKTNPSDLVTEMDEQIEAFYVEKIQESFPDHQIYGEEGEYGPLEDTTGFIWIIDPIDGTLNYVKQKSNFCSMISLYKDGEGILAFIADVVHKECYWTVKGEGVYCNDVKLEPVPDHSLEEGLLAVNTKLFKRDPETVSKLVKDALGLRLIGSAGLEMVQVLTNRTSAYVTSPMHPWDVAAGFMMAQELGIRFTRTDGSPIQFMEDNGFIMACPTVHEELLSKYNDRISNDV